MIKTGRRDECLSNGDRLLTPANFLWTSAGLFFGALIGAIGGTLLAFLYDGAWILLLLALPLLLLQFALEGTIIGIASLWRRWRGLTPMPSEVERGDDLPRPLRWGFAAGKAAGALFGVVNY